MSFFIKKEEAESQANNFATLGFFKKSNNQLVAFIIFISLLTLLMTNFLVEKLNENSEPTQNIEIFIGIAVYLLLAVFIFFNHRWAMIVFALLYIADKIILISSGVGFPISQIMFGAIAVSLTYNAFKDATALKKQKKST